MKKILLYTALMFSCSFGFETYNINEFNDFLNSLNLSNKQLSKIEKITSKYNPSLTRLNAQIILKDMQIAKLRGNSKANQNILILKSKRNSLIEEFDKTKAQRDDEILSSLSFFQKRKYRKYIKTR